MSLLFIQAYLSNKATIFPDKYSKSTFSIKAKLYKNLDNLPDSECLCLFVAEELGFNPYCSSISLFRNKF